MRLRLWRESAQRCQRVEVGEAKLLRNAKRSHPSGCLRGLRNSTLARLRLWRESAQRCQRVEVGEAKLLRNAKRSHPSGCLRGSRSETESQSLPSLAAVLPESLPPLAEGVGAAAGGFEGGRCLCSTWRVSAHPPPFASEYSLHAAPPLEGECSTLPKSGGWRSQTPKEREAFPPFGLPARASQLDPGAASPLEGEQARCFALARLRLWRESGNPSGCLRGASHLVPPCGLVFGESRMEFPRGHSQGTSQRFPVACGVLRTSLPRGG